MGEYDYDANHALAMLRDDVQNALHIAYQPKELVEGVSPGKLLELLVDIAETFDNLDDHLTKGGVAPNAWSRS